jgi:transcription elongation factor Elf1
MEGTKVSPEYHKVRRTERKVQAVLYKGGKCQICGYDKNMAALSFHHVDPSTKIFGCDSRNLENKSWNTVLRELDKCILVCANCHMEIEHPCLPS